MAIGLESFSLISCLGCTLLRAGDGCFLTSPHILLSELMHYHCAVISNVSGNTSVKIKLSVWDVSGPRDHDTWCSAPEGGANNPLHESGIYPYKACKPPHMSIWLLGDWITISGNAGEKIRQHTPGKNAYQSDVSRGGKFGSQKWIFKTSP